MKTVAIISEYNPFHLGHLYQLKEIRKKWGEDTAIVALMSGHFVERGDLAVMHKYDRARTAVDAGVSLVLELPFPYSMGSAEFFADSAVSILDRLGMADILSFGSECGNLDLLTEAACRLTGEAFQSQLQSNKEKSKGYASLLTASYQALYGKDAFIPFLAPNDTLAVCYLSAIQKQKSALIPHTIKRSGTDTDGPSQSILAGATYVRRLLLEGKLEEALSHMPPSAHAVWREAWRKGLVPVSQDRLSSWIVSSLRLQDKKEDCPFAECGGGLYQHLLKCAASCQDLSSLLQAAATKKYTHARIRRAIFYSLLGVTPDMLRTPPCYTQVLAMDTVGQRLLAHIRKTAKISILTKPSDMEKLSPAGQRQAALAHRADSVYALASPLPVRGNTFLCMSPYRK